MNRETLRTGHRETGSEHFDPRGPKLQSLPVFHTFPGCKALYLLMFFGSYAPGWWAMPCWPDIPD
jgi:hypothetical protein